MNKTPQTSLLVALVAVAVLLVACTVTIPPLLLRGYYVTAPGPDGSVRFEMVAESVTPLGQIVTTPHDAGVAPDAAPDAAPLNADANAVVDSGARPDASAFADAGVAPSAVLGLGVGTNVGKNYYWSGSWQQLNAWNQGRAFTDAYGAVAIIPQRAGGSRVVTWASGTLSEIHGRRPSTTEQQARRFAYSVTLGTEPWGIVRGSGLTGVRDVEVANETRSDKWHPAFTAALAGYKTLRFMDWGETNNSPQTTWASRPQPGRDFPGETGGVTYEDMLDLANTVGMTPWVCIPHMVDDGYALELARLLAARLPVSGKVLVEYSNEVWNGMFTQARYAADRGLALGLSTNEHEARLKYQVRRSRELWAVMSPVLGDRMVRVIGSQYVSTWASGLLMTDCAGACDALAIAPYFTAATTTAVDEVVGYIRQQKALAVARGVPLIAYEGGQHLTTTDCATTNRAASMGTLYDRLLAGWRAEGGGVFVHYNGVERYVSGNCWGATERQDVVASPKLDALRRAMTAWR